MRYIDLDKLINDLKETIKDKNTNDLAYTVFSIFIERLEKEPTVDAVEVVRCKNCVNRNTPDCAMWYQCSICGSQWSWNVANGFCWCGEKGERE